MPLLTMRKLFLFLIYFLRRIWKKNYRLEGGKSKTGGRQGLDTQGGAANRDIYASEDWRRKVGEAPVAILAMRGG
ncbi:hypothetical protein I3843_11G185600 [Carya illinoinensis]|nr:hypothetical protein I3843_11G185600 [Carya illinoinensis]